MSLSTSRQQFLAYETHADQENIHYRRKGGVFISTCICICFIVVAALIAALVGIIVYYITYYKVSQQPEDFWNEAEPFGQATNPSSSLRLPTIVTPSFYRLKIKADLEASTFTGDVLITIRASKSTKEVILHSKGLSINENITLTEQTYQNVPTTKSKREINTTENASTATTEQTDAMLANLDNETVTTVTPTSNVNDSTSTLPSNTEVTTTNVPVIETTLISVKEVTLSNVRDIKLKNMEFTTGDRLILHLETPLTPNVDYTLQMTFHGEILNTLTSFYKSTYKENNVDKQFGVTQFEPTAARAAFPCFDEPAFKAKFEISIAHRQNYSVLSNMKISAQEPIETEPGWQWTHFDRSVQMSTYLVAYVLSDFSHEETSYVSKDNVTKPIRVWARPSLIKNARYALTIIPKLLAFYEDVFGLPYALDKVDFVAIPDFSNSAMENWGLITFRETTLLYDEEEAIPRLKQNIAIDVAHELAHQWFGNLVTMKWWTDLWLNEGFATYIEYVGVNHITPEWNILESLTRDKMNLLKTDALKSTSPVSREVADASEIAQKFDEISYSKGANLIRMLNHTISYDLFHDALVIYLNKWKYQNAEENDLWDAMSDATQSDPSLKGLSVKQFMNTWTRQPGYPVVNVNRDYDTGHVTFQQELFTNTRDPSKNTERKWVIPISYTTTDVPVGNWSTKPKLWLNEKTLRPQLPANRSQALYVNVDAIGYYRVNYDQKNWELLSAALKSKTINSPITKAQLIDDAFAMAKAGQLNYSYALGLSTCVLDGEDSKIVWDMLLDNLYYLKANLRATSGYIYFQDYIKLLLKKQLERVNYGLNKPKDDNEAFLIENLVVWECLVESPRCLNWAKDEFEKLIEKPDSSELPNYLRSLVYATVLKYGGRREFDLMWNLYLNATDPSTQNTILSNMPATRDEALITLLLEKSLTEIPNQSASILWSVEPPVGTRIAQVFLVDNFDEVYDKFTKIDAFMFPIVLNSVFGSITTKDDLDRFKHFALEHKEKLMPVAQSLQKIIDSATLRIRWIKKYAAGINHWLKQYVTEKATHFHTNTTPAPALLPQNTTINVTENASTTSSPLPASR